MNTRPPPPKEAPAPPASAQEDPFDDSYAWAGYESAQPLSLAGADRAVSGEGEPLAD